MSAKDLLRSAGRRYVVQTLSFGARVMYRVRRLSAKDLLKQGTFELPGLALLQELRSEAVDTQERDFMILGCNGDEEKIAALRERWATYDAAQERKQQEALARDPARLEAVMARLATWVCAGVEAIAALPDDVTPEDLPDGLLPDDATPEAGDDALSFEPLRFVVALDPGAEDRQFLVADLDDVTLSGIATAIVRASVADPREVSSFRGGAGSPASRP